MELIQAAQALNPDLRGYTLLTKTRSNTASRRDVRAALDETALLPVLSTEISLWEAIAGAEGTVPATLDAYEEALEELSMLGLVSK